MNRVQNLVAMSINDFFNRENISPLLRLPRELREKVFSGTHMDQREKYVLANLYHLDSLDKLNEYADMLPAMTDMSLEKCLESVKILEQKGFVARKGRNLILKIKPLTYK